MQRRLTFYRTICLALLAVVGIAACGCRSGSLQVPRIDPTGRRIFARDSATTLVGPDFSLCPTPAYQDPPLPPICPEGTVLPSETESGGPLTIWPPATCGPASPAPQLPSGTVRTVPPCAARAGTATLQVSPTRVIAPVGSEVVLLAGLCGSDGYYVLGQPIEWMLSEDSAGHFVELGSEGRPCWRWMIGRAPKKITGSFAKANTSTAAEVLTRGTPDQNDDVWLLRGQTWISVTSNSEGTSRVTCLAPKVENWDRRTQAATIHWIDAEWVFPPPVVGRAGQAYTLATTVTQRTSPAPVVGWIVRYEILDGPPASFGPQGATAVEVPTDAFGKGAVQIVGTTTQPGVTRVRVQIIRPPAPGDGLTRQVIGQGFTSVTWSASGLSLNVTGPETAEVDSIASYQVQVSNPGDLAATNVLVTDELPPGVRLENSNPAGQQFGNRVEWQLGSLGPRETRQLTVNCRMQTPGAIRHCVKAQSGEGVIAEGCTVTNVVSQALDVQMMGPTTAVVGQKVKFDITIINRGNTPLTGLQLLDTFDPGFQHPTGEGSPIQRFMGDLAPGEQRAGLSVEFTVVAVGQICHTLQITADGGHAQARRSCLTAMPAPQQASPQQPRLAPQPAPEQNIEPQPEPATGPPAQPIPATPVLTVRKTAPKQSRVGEKVLFRIQVTNTGRVAAENIQIADRYPASLRPVEASRGWQNVDGKLAWTISRLLPGETAEREVRCLCVEADRAACNRVTVTTPGGLALSDEACVEIFLPPEPPETDGGGPEITPPVRPGDEGPPDGVTDQTPVSGELRMSVVDLGDPIKVGEKTKFVITIKNDRQVSDKKVVLTLTLPAGVALEKLDSPMPTDENASGSRILKSQPIAELRAGEEINVTVTVVARKAGKYQFKAVLSSLRTPTPITVEEDLTVNVE